MTLSARRVFKVIKYCIITSYLEPSRTFVYFNPKMCGIIYVGAGKFAESVCNFITYNRHANSRRQGERVGCFSKFYAAFICDALQMRRVGEKGATAGERKFKTGAHDFLVGAHRKQFINMSLPRHVAGRTTWIAKICPVSPLIARFSARSSPPS